MLAHMGLDPVVAPVRRPAPTTGHDAKRDGSPRVQPGDQAAIGMRAPVAGWVTPPRNAPDSELPHSFRTPAAAAGCSASRARAGTAAAPGAAGVVLVGGPAVEDDVVVQQLDVARHERRMQAVLLRDLREQIQRLVLRRGHARHFGELLRLLDIGAGILAGELAVLDAEHRQREARLRAMTPSSSPRPRSANSPGTAFQQIRPATQYFVVDRRDAGELADAAGLVALRTHSRAMTSQRSVCQRSGPVERARARDDTTLPASDSHRSVGQSRFRRAPRP